MKKTQKKSLAKFAKKPKNSIENALSAQENISVISEPLPNTETEESNTKMSDTLTDNLLKTRDSRLPAAGTVITKIYHGQTLEVKVLENGFEYQGKIYKSISRVAMEIVQRPISGYVFFGLTK